MWLTGSRSYRRRRFAFVAAGEDDSIRRERAAEFFDREIAERFARAAGEGMQDDERFAVVKALERVAGGQWKTKRALHFDAEVFDQSEITFDRVRTTIDGRDMVVKTARAFARIVHAVKLARMTHPPNKRAPEQSLEIESHVRSQPSGLPHPGQETRGNAQTAELAPRENMDVGDAVIPAEERRPLGIDHPGNARIRVSVAEQGNRWQRVDNIA